MKLVIHPEFSGGKASRTRQKRKEIAMKKKNPSRVTLARRAVDDEILKIARLISNRLAEKARPINIAVCGVYLAELYHVLGILTTHERAGRRELTAEAVQQIGSMMTEGYNPSKEVTILLGLVF